MLNHHFLIALITIAAFMGVVLTLCAYLIYVERKLAAFMQDRIGPNRVGPLGLLQPLADGLKFLMKEEIIPSHVDRLFFLLAPSIAVMTTLMAAAIVPFGPTTAAPTAPSLWSGTVTPDQQKTYEAERDKYRQTYQFVIAPNVDIGILFTFAVGSLAVYAIILGGWSSNNKYSLLGALRSSAQLISYEIPLGMAVVGVVIAAGSLNLERIIQQQADGAWNVFYQPLAFLLFFTSVLAECNRVPFDLPEAEQELVGGYHTEYSAMKFGMFFLGEYTHVITTSLLLTIVFLGGWHFPWIAGADALWIVKLLVLTIKVLAFIVVYMLIRWTIPRFRFDQLMGLAWKVLMPLALANMVCVLIVKEFKLSMWLLLPASLVLLIGAGLLSLRPATRTVIR